MFLDDVYAQDVFKKVIVQWMKQFNGVKEKIDDDRDLYVDFMRHHFPNRTQNPHQLYLNDFDETE